MADTATQENDILKAASKLAKSQMDIVEISGNEILKSGFPIDDPSQSAYDIASTLYTSQQKDKSQWYDYIISSVVSVGNAIRQRSSGIVNIPFSVLAGADDTISQEALDLVNAILDTKSDGFKLSRLFTWMYTAEYKGFSVSEFNWAYNQIISDASKEYFVPIQMLNWDNIHFVFDAENNIKWIDKSGGDTTKGEELTQPKYLIHQNEATVENPYGKSIMDVGCIYLAWIHQEAVRQYLQYCNRLGIPPMMYTVPANVWQNEGQKALIKTETSSLYKKKVIVMPEGSTANTLESSASHADIYMNLIRYCDEQLSLAVLGQSNTSSSDGGSRARDEIAIDITDDYIKSTCQEIGYTLNTFIKRICDINFAGQKYEYPYFEFEIEKKDDKELTAKTYKTYYDMGLELSKTEIYERGGYTQPITEEDTLKSSTSTEGTQQELFTDPIVQNSKKKSNSSIFSKDKVLQFAEKIVIDDIGYTNKLLDKHLKKAVKAFQPITAAIEKAVSKSDTPQEFVDNLNIKSQDQEQFDKVVLDMITFIFLQGYWIERKAIQPELKQAFSNGGSQLDLYGNIIHFQENYVPEAILPFEQSLQYFKNLTPAMVNELSDGDSELAIQMREKSFWITQSTSLQATKKVYQSLTKAFDEGIASRKWLSQNRGLFESLGFSEKDSYYLENVYRTNASISYNTGHWRQQQDPIVQELLPNRMYRTVGDDRVRPNHVAMDGIIRPTNDPIWDTWYTPNGYQCRCVIVMLSNSTMRRRGYRTTRTPPEVSPDKGWETNIVAGWLETNPPLQLNLF